MAEANKRLFGFFGSKKKVQTDEKRRYRTTNKDTAARRRRDQSSKRDQHGESARLDQRSQSDEGQSRKSSSTKGGSSNALSNHQAVHTEPTPLPPPLTSWPPPGIARDASLNLKQALQFILPGAPVFRGTKQSIPHASDDYYHLYASCAGNGDLGDDCGDVYTSAFEVDSMSLRHLKAAQYPWETLEQPSMAFYYGTRPGEITLNHWISLSQNPSPYIELRDPGVKPRSAELSVILKRLIYLESGFEEEYEDLRYKNLYGKFLRDPDRHSHPHKDMEKQIADLILVLSSSDWIDFSLPKNQVVGKFFANVTYTDRGEGRLFFYQVLLGLELYLRVYSKQFEDAERDELVRQLPPRISWTLALARKWQECIKIEPLSEGEQGKIRYQLRNKKAQVKALRRFARVMKWPNLLPVDNLLKEESHSRPLEDKSSDALSYFSGVILPGVTLPWLILNTLIDCDADAGVNALAALTHMYPLCGFQYRSTTYWSALSIVGKVLAPTCKSVAGWVGPARPAPDLSRIAIARIRQRPVKDFVSPQDVIDMSELSDPLGPSANSYPVTEYSLPIPEIDPDYLTNNIRIEKLALKPVPQSPSSSSDRKQMERNDPILYDATLQFAIAGESWPLKLSYDVSFISACPCALGPHPLFFDYTYQTVKIEDLLDIQHWGSSRPPHNNTSSTLASPPSPPNSYVSQAHKPAKPDTRPSSPPDSKVADAEHDDKVLVIEAFGIQDNEVLARAWCAHWALSAIVADTERTCLACAVREAYAGCLKVVILVEKVESDE